MNETSPKLRNIVPWNKETARAASERAKAARQARAALKRANELGLESIAPCGPDMPGIGPDVVRGLSLGALRNRLDWLDRCIASTMDPEKLDMLTRSFERLFLCWARLAGLPDPGSLRHRPATGRIIDQATLLPLGLSKPPQPVVVEPVTQATPVVSTSGSNGAD